jgi:hypothetical protein
MRALAACVKVVAGRPTLEVVVVEGSPAAPINIDRFTIGSNATDALTVQLHEVSAAMRSRISGLNPERVVIRRADHMPASNREGPRTRLLAEGAVASAAQDEVANVLLLDGPALAQKAFSEAMSVMDARAAVLLPGVPPKLAGAAVAGLAI